MAGWLEEDIKPLTIQERCRKYLFILKKTTAQLGFVVLITIEFFAYSSVHSNMLSSFVTEMSLKVTLIPRIQSCFVLVILTPITEELP